MDLRRELLWCLLVVALSSAVLATEFRPHDNINMQGFNVTNASFLCLGADCRNSWPAGGGGGGNASWSESYANGIYYRVSNGSLDNSSWNETRANTLYPSFSYIASLKWLLGSGANITNVSNGTIVNFTGGTGINIVEVGTGPINVTFILNNTAVSSGSYGSGLNIPIYTVDAQGRLTSASNMAHNLGNWSADKVALPNLTYAQIVTSIGNWSADKGALPNLTLSAIATNIGNYSDIKRTYGNCSAGQYSSWNGTNFTCATDVTSGTGGNLSTWTVSNGPNASQVLNNTILNFTAGSGIQLTQVGNSSVGGINITITSTASGGSGSGWLNTSSQVYLVNNATNLSVAKMWWVDNTINVTGVMTVSPPERFVVNGTQRIIPEMWGTTVINDSSVNATVTTINVTNASGYPEVGTLLIENEAITYTGRTSTNFTGVTRAVLGTANVSHSSAAAVNSLIFSVSRNATAPILSITSNGTVGVGVLNPLQKFTVVGSGNITGSTYLGNTLCTSGQTLVADSATGLVSCWTPNLGNWSADKTTLPNITHAQIVTAEGNWSADKTGIGWILGIGAGNKSTINNNTILNITNGTGIAITQVGTGPVNLSISAFLNAFTTADLIEGANLYFTNARATAVSAWTNTSTVVSTDKNVNVTTGNLTLPTNNVSGICFIANCSIRAYYNGSNLIIGG